MVESGDRRDTACEQSIDKPVVEVDAPPIDGPVAFRQDRGQAMENRYEPSPRLCIRSMSFPAVVVVAGHCPDHYPAPYSRGVWLKRIPDRVDPAVGGDRTLDLVGRCNPS